MQHEVFQNPVARVRKSFPLIVDLQANYVMSDERLCAPLYAVGTTDVIGSRAMPIITIQDQPFRLLLVRMTAIDMHRLRRPVGSVAAFRDDITRALAWIFTGI